MGNNQNLWFLRVVMVFGIITFATAAVVTFFLSWFLCAVFCFFTFEFVDIFIKTEVSLYKSRHSEPKNDLDDIKASLIMEFGELTAYKFDEEGSILDEK